VICDYYIMGAKERKKTLHLKERLPKVQDED
jgi:hypothetical protein